MNYKLEIRKRAYNQIRESYQFYESRTIGLGERFLRTIYSYLEKIENNPHLFSVRKKTFREAYIKKFPFLIVYEILGDTIIVYSIFHTSRNPAKKP